MKRPGSHCLNQMLRFSIMSRQPDIVPHLEHNKEHTHLLWSIAQNVWPESNHDETIRQIQKSWTLPKGQCHGKQDEMKKELERDERSITVKCNNEPWLDPGFKGQQKQQQIYKKVLWTTGKILHIK